MGVNVGVGATVGVGVGTEVAVAVGSGVWVGEGTAVTVVVALIVTVGFTCATVVDEGAVEPQPTLGKPNKNIKTVDNTLRDTFMIASRGNQPWCPI